MDLFCEQAVQVVALADGRQRVPRNRLTAAIFGLRLLLVVRVKAEFAVANIVDVPAADLDALDVRLFRLFLPFDGFHDFALLLDQLESVHVSSVPRLHPFEQVEELWCDLGKANLRDGRELRTKRGVVHRQLA